MNPQAFHYAVLPSIVRADEETAVTIHPLGENVAFLPGATYTVSIREVDTACAYYGALPTTVYECTPNEAGDLVITHRFCGEQKHVLVVSRPECDLYSPHYDINYRKKYSDNITAVLGVYSLGDDLYGLRCYKGEVHCHTYESDGIQDVCHTVGNYRSAGYDFMAITDHYLSMSSEKSKRIFDNAPVDMTLFLGEEVHVPNERIHAVHLGGRESVNAYFRAHPDEARQEVDAIQATLDLPEDINPEDYAWRIWIARKAREFGGLSILSHPHWVWNEVYFMASSLTKQLLRDGIHDAFDLADTQSGSVADSVALWNDLCSEGIRIPIVGSTDSHRTDPSNPNQPAKGGYTLVFAPDRSCQSIMDSIRAERSLFVNTQCEPEFIHGSYRLVKYARFLLEFFYPVYMRLCQGQGVVMSEYPAQGVPSQELVSLLDGLNKRSEAFAHGFYGYE